MTRAEACAELTKRWGQRARYRVGRSLSSPTQREAARALLAPLYAEQTALRVRITALEREARYYKFEVIEQISRGPFPISMVHGYGDTWEEAFAAADHRSPFGDTATEAAAVKLQA